MLHPRTHIWAVEVQENDGKYMLPSIQWLNFVSIVTVLRTSSRKRLRVRSRTLLPHALGLLVRCGLWVL